MIKESQTGMNPPTGGWLLASLIYDSIWPLKTNYIQMKKLFTLLFFCIGIFFEQTAQTKQGSCLNDIYFTVPVNIRFPNNLSRESRLEDSVSIYYDEVILKLPKIYSKTGRPTRLVYCAQRV